MWWMAWAASALATTVTLGSGRAAVLEPALLPHALSVSKPSVVDVIVSPPHLVVLGKQAGTAVLTLEHPDGNQVVTVQVGRSAAVDATGDGVAAGGPRLELKPDQGVLYTLPAAPSAHTLLDPAVVQLEPFLERTFFVQGRKSGVTDLVFEREGASPLVLTVAVLAEGGSARPDGVVEPTGILEMEAGGDTTLRIGKPVNAVLVGHPSRLQAEPVDGAPDQLWLVSQRAGTTTLLVHTGSETEVWMRQIVMTRREE